MTQPIIPTLKAMYDARHQEMEAWFSYEYSKTPPSVYSSVDIRHSGIKLAPVDTNLFPAGFNNLSAAAQARATMQIKAYASQQGRPVERILIIPENHTRNQGYIANLFALRAIVHDAGFEVKAGSLAAPSGEPVELTSADGTVLLVHPLIRRGNTLATEGGFIPDLILINNDLTSGLPPLLQGVTQPMVPSPRQGWHRRKKSIYFRAYAKVAQQFAQDFGIDPWLISAIHHQCGRVNFGERTGAECMALGVEKVLHQVRSKYAQYGVDQEPYVYIKADAGTYGMGIMTVRSGEEVYEINKRARNKMNVIKEGVQNTEVIIQEGVPTIDMHEGASAEPMLYLVAGQPVGGAYRVNDQRDALGNLNAAGMKFVGMCDEQEPADAARKQVQQCNYTVLGLIGRLATLAAGREDYGEDWVI